MEKKTHILFTAAFSTTFIQEDLSFLRARYSVKEIISSGITTFFKFLRALPASDVTFSWFASIYSSSLVFLTKLFNKKSIIILGGVDVANIPEFDYGIWNSRWKSMIVRYGIMNADIVLAVDDSLKQDAMRLARYDGRNIFVVPTGYDSDRWKPGKTKEKFVLTVAQCDSVKRIKIKGIDFLFSVANAMPEQSFVLIGVKKEIAEQFKVPPNVTYFDSAQQNNLLEYYQKAAVYFQPSFREGLPNTLCEAMLCECYPIGTKVGGIASAIGETGTLINYGDVKEAQRAIMHGLNGDSAPAARERIAKLFSKQSREQQLSLHIDSLIHEK